MMASEIFHLRRQIDIHVIKIIVLYEVDATVVYEVIEENRYQD